MRKTEFSYVHYYWISRMWKQNQVYKQGVKNLTADTKNTVNYKTIDWLKFSRHAYCLVSYVLHSYVFKKFDCTIDKMKIFFMETCWRRNLT